MKVLIDVVSPGQIHFFRPIVERLRNQGDEVVVTSRHKDVMISLLEGLGISHISLSVKGDGILGLATELVTRTIRLYRLVKEFQPDALMSQTGVSISIVGALLKIPRIVLEEAEHARLQRFLGLPLATVILTGYGYTSSHGRRERKFEGIWVQSYLHPSYFSPDRTVLEKAKVELQRPIIVLRIIAWDAAHDFGMQQQKTEALQGVISQLEAYGKVYLSFEGNLPTVFEEYRIPVAPHEVHHLLAFSSLYIGEGGTMAAEAAVLGVPSIYCSPIRCGYMSFLESRELLVCTNDLQEGLGYVQDLLENRTKCSTQSRKELLWDQTEDIASCFVQETGRVVRAEALSQNRVDG